MIAKEKVQIAANSPTSVAGDKQERDVAFYLRREFKDHPSVFIFNDLKITHNDENAQIDHLILYPYGFILIESKSITGEVKVNKHEEWTRSYRGNWQGMPSPIKQVELQQKLLKELLQENKASILKTIMFKQQSFRWRCWDSVCAVSSNAIIDRDSMHKGVSDKLVKSEFLVEKLNKMMNIKNSIVETLTFDTRPGFCSSDLESIKCFLLAHAPNVAHANNDTCPVAPKPVVEKELVQTTSAKDAVAKSIKLACRKCGCDSKLEAMYGRYGYYVKCHMCQGNTPMKQPCISCGEQTAKVQKRGEKYSLICEQCKISVPISV